MSRSVLAWDCRGQGGRGLGECDAGGRWCGQRRRGRWWSLLCV